MTCLSQKFVATQLGGVSPKIQARRGLAWDWDMGLRGLAFPKEDNGIQVYKYLYKVQHKVGRSIVHICTSFLPKKRFERF